MAIVWPCPDSVDVYAAAGPAVVVPRLLCPACGEAVGFWAGYARSVRVGGLCHRVWIRRGRCGPCAMSHALIPSFVLVGRLDGVEAIGEVIEAVAAGRSGVRPLAAGVGVLHTTARDWVRRFEFASRMPSMGSHSCWRRQRCPRPPSIGRSTAPSGAAVDLELALRQQRECSA